jgi:hypothetical protein
VVRDIVRKTKAIIRAKATTEVMSQERTLNELVWRVFGLPF